MVGQMATFTYFAYGSNMLTQWLKVRCNSARPLRSACASGCRVAFSKKSKDGSGKAPLEPVDGEIAYGVLF